MWYCCRTVSATTATCDYYSERRGLSAEQCTPPLLPVTTTVSRVDVFFFLSFTLSHWQSSSQAAAKMNRVVLSTGPAGGRTASYSSRVPVDYIMLYNVHTTATTTSGHCERRRRQSAGQGTCRRTCPEDLPAIPYGPCHNHLL